MMPKNIICIAVLLIAFSAYVSGQSPNWFLPDRGNDDYDWLISVRNTPLFNQEEIKKRGIKSCTIYSTRKNRENKITSSDSVAFFTFDPEGNVTLGIRRVRKTDIYYMGWDTTIGKTRHYSEDEKIDSIFSFQKGHLVLTTYYKYKFDPQSNRLDTGSVSTEIFDNKNRVLESRNQMTLAAVRYSGCWVGFRTCHKYKYDRHGNIRYFYLDDEVNRYTKFRYHKFSRTVREYDAQTKKLTRRYTVPVHITSDSIVEKLSSTTSMYRLKKNSKLFRLIKNVYDNVYFYSLQEFSLHYEYADKKKDCEFPEKLVVAN